MAFALLGDAAETCDGGADAAETCDGGTDADGFCEGGAGAAFSGGELPIISAGICTFFQSSPGSTMRAMIAPIGTSFELSPFYFITHNKRMCFNAIINTKTKGIILFL